MYTFKIKIGGVCCISLPSRQLANIDLRKPLGFNLEGKEEYLNIKYTILQFTATMDGQASEEGGKNGVRK